ncbi:MAG: metallophosphoesterase family protein [Candidatus Hermodarchaeia archaeon]
MAQDAEFNFIGYGDTRGYDLSSGVSPLHAGLVNLYLQEDPELVVHTGDMVKEGGNWSQWLDFNESMQAVWAAEIPFYGAVGNHEMYGNDEDFSNYTTFFDFSSVVDTPGETELHYGFTYEGIHFVFLNTEYEWNAGQFTCSSGQMSWFSSYLADTTAEAFIVAVFHRPAWSIRADRPDRWAEAESVREEFHDLFVEYDVDLVLTGHDHYYYRTLRDGLYYVTTGGGGAPLAGINTSAPIWQPGDVAASEYHYCNIEVNSTEVTVTAYKLDHSLVDSFNIERPSSPPPPFPIELILIGLYLIIIIVVIVLVIYWRRKTPP